MRIFVLRLLPLLVLPLAACAPLTENERYESENRLILVKEQYAQRAESCENHPGPSADRTTLTTSPPNVCGISRALT